MGDGRRPVVDPADVCIEVGAWPIRLTVGGISGWTLWFGDEEHERLPLEGRRILVFRTRARLRAAVDGLDGSLAPSQVVALVRPVIGTVLAAKAETFDIDAAATWFGDPTSKATVEACGRALDAMNMADDIGLTVRDRRITDAARSGPFRDALDGLTMGVNFIGEGSPVHQNALAMIRAMDRSAGTVAAEVAALAGSYVDLR